MKLSRLSLIAVIAMCALAAGSTVIIAQDTNAAPGAAHGQKAGHLRDQFQKIAEDLQLTDKQKQEARPIFRDFFEKAKGIRQDTSLEQPQRREQMKDLRQDVSAKLKGILTSEQLQKWQNLRQEHSKKQSS